MRESTPESVFKQNFKLIPSHFNRCCCVSFSCTNCCTSRCFGGRCSGRSCFCVEGEGIWWQTVDHGTNCCVCFSGDFDLASPQSCCSLYNQTFCCECFWTSSCKESGYVDPPNTLSTVEDRYIPEHMDKSLIILGGCCTLFNLYFVNSMFGNYNRQTAMCYESEFISTRCLYCQAEYEENPEVVCKLFQGHASLSSQCQFFKCINQALCIDMRFALPCDKEVPNVCMILPLCTLFASGWFNILFCKTVGGVAKLSYPERISDTTDGADGSKGGNGEGDGVGGAGRGSGGRGSVERRSVDRRSRGNDPHSPSNANGVLIASHLVIPLHTPGTGNDTGIQYAEVVGSVDENTKSESVTYAQAVNVDVRGNML